MSIKAVVIPTSLKEPLSIADVVDYTSYYSIIGCRTFDLVCLDNTDTLSVDCYLDDEGMINGSDVNEYFLRAYRLGKCYQPFWGIGAIVLTYIDSGESTDLDLDLVKNTLRGYGFTEDELSVL